MFEYVCEHVIPGCSHRHTADTEERALELAHEHLHEHHGMEYLDEDVTRRAAAAIQRVAVR